MKTLIILMIVNAIALSGASQTPEAILNSKNIILPSLPAAAGNYASLVTSGKMIYLSGRGPLQPDGKYVTGKLGRDLTATEGYQAARLCGLAQIAVLKAELGDLSKIKRIVKVTGFVNGTDLFTDQPAVINGFSDLMTEVFGKKGLHARSAVGVASLPAGWPVEVEMIVEIN